MTFLHITNQTEKTADINLFSQIYDGSGQRFVNELNYLDAQGLEVINVHINSKGGDVFEGFGIVSAIQNAKTPITTINEGISASTAGWILAVGNNRKSVDFGQVMIHGLSIGGENAQNSEETSVLNKIKTSVVKIFANNTKMTEEEASELMNGTTFMNAAEALKLGIIDEIIDTKRKIKNSIAPDELLNLVHNNFNEKPKSNKMNLISNYLKLNSDSTEESVLNAIKANEETANGLFVAEETAHKETKEALEAVQNELKTFKDAAIVKTIENAIEEGKIKGEDKEKMISLANEAPEAFNSILESVQPARQKLSDTIDNSSDSADEKKDWSIRDYEKKAPELLNEMISNDFEKYSELYEAEYKVKPRK
jgi:ATP-dependent Clp endopeptidase proteolytic subunit ClpP